MMNLKILLAALALIEFCGCAPLETVKENDESISADGEDDRTRDRQRRAFDPWQGTHEQYQRYESFTAWKAPIYQLSRPYYIPIYGVSGRLPMYFPPQSFNPFRGPPYLPPIEGSKGSTEKPKTPPPLGTKLGEFDDDRPVWGTVTGNTIENVPTRPPYPKIRPPFPPLVHDISKSDGNTMQLSVNPEVSKNIDAVFGTASTTRRPAITTRRPASNSAARPADKSISTLGPSNCVWAVVACCSANTEEVPESCFEQRGCPGPFWDRSPCSGEYAKSALDMVMKYYAGSNPKAP